MLDIVLRLTKITPGVAFARDDDGRTPLHMLYDPCPQNDVVNVMWRIQRDI